MSAPGLLLHGGVPGIWVGGIVKPNMAEHRYVPGCQHCEAQAAGINLGDAPTPEGWVYASSDRAYARYYASRAVFGTLYRVRLEGDVERSEEDPPQFPTWRARRAVVVAVLEWKVLLTMKQRRDLFVRWGGSESEFESMLSAVLSAGGAR